MDVLFYDPYKPDGYDKSLGIRRAETLDELLRRSFVVSLHCPLTPETRHMMNESTLRRMPARGYLINTARGDVVDTTAVVAAIEAGHLAGAGIDVLAQEPPPVSDPMITAWRNPEHPAHHRLILNPHAAFYSVQGMMDMRTKGAEACRRALLGEPIRNLVNQPIG
jgi:D-3-phosphoglycerate dehydrogenase/C-terminal binding protein